jgi:N-acetylmuramoyl-L-alanine amidase
LDFPDNPRMRRAGCLLFLLLLAAPARPQDRSGTSLLAESFDWRTLNIHQGGITQEEFARRLAVMSPDGSMDAFLAYTEDSVAILDQAKLAPVWSLAFASQADESISHPRRPTDLLAGPEKPLQGLRLCLDPGHIGGAWANLEERYFRIGKDKPILEAELNMLTCRLLEQMLVEDGAEVVWTKQDYQPVTPLRPEDFLVQWTAIDWLARGSPKDLRKLFATTRKTNFETRWTAEKFFYRAAEIQARAERVRELRPHLTLCVHYNAAPWPRPGRPSLLRANKLVVFVHGSYTKGEIEDEYSRFCLMRKLLEGSLDEEIATASAIGTHMQKTWGWRAESYEGGFSHRVNSNPYVWSRNLVANRAFPGPVIFVEGPYMNDRAIYKRLQAGDYEGEQEIGGVRYRSLFREFAEIMHAAVLETCGWKPEPEPPARR